VKRDRKDFFTDFWGGQRFRWPADVLSSIRGLPVASAAALMAYRRYHATLQLLVEEWS
jgi:hypothetical protein